MPTKTNTFELETTVSRASAAVARTLTELGWEYDSEEGITVAREDPAGLCCSMAPVKASIGLIDDGALATRIELEVSVPGFGPVPKRQLADRCAGLEQRIRRWEADLASTTPAGA